MSVEINTLEIRQVFDPLIPSEYWLTMLRLDSGAQDHLDPHRMQLLAAAIRADHSSNALAHVFHETDGDAIYIALPLQGNPDDAEPAINKGIAITWNALDVLELGDTVTVDNVKANLLVDVGALTLEKAWLSMNGAGNVLDTLQEEFSVYAQADVLDFME